MIFVGKALKKNHFDTLGRMQCVVTNMNKCTQEGGETLKQIEIRTDDTKVLPEGVAAQAHIQQEEVKGLKKLLEEAQSALEIMKECISQLADDADVALVHYIKEERRQMVVLYYHPDLIPLHPLKMVLGGELVDEE